MRRKVHWTHVIVEVGVHGAHLIIIAVGEATAVLFGTIAVAIFAIIIFVIATLGDCELLQQCAWYRHGDGGFPIRLGRRGEACHVGAPAATAWGPQLLGGFRPFVRIAVVLVKVRVQDLVGPFRIRIEDPRRVPLLLCGVERFNHVVSRE